MNINAATNLLERAMMEQPKKIEVENPYLAGFVDALFDSGLISDDIRTELYIRYAEKGRVKGVNGPDVQF